ncbi:MAG: GNAT family N-acetyltransferase [Gaiellaceae bacterium]
MNVRPYTPGDAASVAALVAADEELWYEHGSRIGAPDVVQWTSLARETWLFEDGGRLLGAGWCTVWGDTGSLAGVAADKGRGIGSEIVRRGEERLRGESIVKIHGIAPEPDEAARRLFESNGYHEARRFFDMAVELHERPPQPVLPDGLVLDELRAGEERAFHFALGDAFQDHWNWQPTPFDEWWQMREGQDRDAEGPLWFVVRGGGELVAVVRNEANRHGGGYVGALAVRRAWRGKGLAKALLHCTFDEFWRRGIRRVTLGVDAESPTGATHLYERVGMAVESCTLVFEKTCA